MAVQIFYSQDVVELHTVLTVVSWRLECGATAQTVKLDCGHELSGVTALPLVVGDLVRCPRCE